MQWVVFISPAVRCFCCHCHCLCCPCLCLCSLCLCCHFLCCHFPCCYSFHCCNVEKHQRRVVTGLPRCRRKYQLLSLLALFFCWCCFPCCCLCCFHCWMREGQRGVFARLPRCRRKYRSFRGEGTARSAARSRCWELGQSWQICPGLFCLPLTELCAWVFVQEVNLYRRQACFGVRGWVSRVSPLQELYEAFIDCRIINVKHFTFFVFLKYMV